MSDEDDIAAAEYVLGTLPADERARFASRLSADPALRGPVDFWAVRLAPLADLAAAETPRPEVWKAIERAASAPTQQSAPVVGSNVIQLRRRLAFWRGSALTAGALAAALAAAMVIDRLAVSPAPDEGRYVAVVDTGGREPALIAEVDTRTGLIRVKSLAAEIPAGRSLELWHIADGGAPRSLGILQAGADGQTIQNAVTAGAIDGQIAVTVEAEGGSPTGTATGPIVYSGRLIPVE